MSLTTAEVYISFTVLFLSLVTIPFYGFIIFVMIHHRRSLDTKNSSVYHQIVIVKGFVDILSAANCCIGSVLPSLGLFPELYLSQYGHAIARVYLLIAWSTRLIQACSCGLLTINRSTLLVSPITSIKIWADNRMRYWIHAIQIFPGLLVVTPLFFEKYKWVTRDYSMFIVFTNAQFRHYYFIAAYAINTIYIIILIASHFVSITVLLKMRMRHGPKQETVFASKNRLKRKMEDRRLFMYSFAVCLIEIMYFLFTIFGFVGNFMSTTMFYFYYNVVNIIYCCSTPYLVLIFSSPLRRRIEILFGFKKSANIITVANVNLKLLQKKTTLRSMTGAAKLQTIPYASGA